MLKIFQFQEDTASLYGDFKRIITNAKFVLCIMHCVLIFEWKGSLNLIHPTHFFYIESINYKVLALTLILGEGVNYLILRVQFYADECNEGRDANP